jgi:hypothetical protein
MIMELRVSAPIPMSFAETWLDSLIGRYELLLLLHTGPLHGQPELHGGLDATAITKTYRGRTPQPQIHLESFKAQNNRL